MSQTPNLGTSWSEAIKSAYAFGYQSFEHSHADIIDEARSIQSEAGRDMAVDFLMNEAQWFINGEDNKRLWWAIDDFYEAHMPQEEYERLQREAAVAEDLDSAFQAGAYDAILQGEYDTSKVSHLHGE